MLRPTSAGGNIYSWQPYMIMLQYSGFTALHFASKEGHAEVCQHLLDSGATEEILDFVSENDYCY